MKEAERKHRRFGHILRRDFAVAGLKGETVAEEAGYTRSTISNWLTGRSAPDAEQLLNLSTTLQKHGVIVDPIEWMHEVFLGEYLEFLGKDNHKSDLLWNLLCAGARRLSDNGLVEGFHHLRALTAFANQYQLLDGLGA